AQSWEGRPAVNARILGMGGHLHDYGVALRLEDVTEKRVIWESTPILDKQGQVIGMPTRRFFWRLGIPIYADHVYRLTAIYENPTGRTIEKGAMGALGGIVMVPRAESWPAADAKHAEYALDLALLTSGSRQHGHAHH
ncbi:MAG: hypothetical protein HY703_13430, partial [Gemmatimonadetes bacterium]|nr:hypothetical protein [Gemmatimonadota bacterium]